MAAAVGPPARPPVMTDVARLAQVSHQTVSRVLNQAEGVRPATRDRVLTAIDTLGYRRNSAARALVTGRSLTIGIVSYNATLYGPASTIDSIEKAARDGGYSVSIAAIHDLGQRSLGQAVDRLLAQAVDGVMVVAPFPLSLSDNIPAVMLHGGPGAGMPFVSVGQELGAWLATQHLLTLGHRTEESGATAIFVASDHMALGLLRAMHETGHRVPDDVCVVGFDDIPEAGFLTPSLSSVRQDFTEVGRRSVALMLAQIDQGSREPARLTRAGARRSAELLPSRPAHRRARRGTRAAVVTARTTRQMTAGPAERYVVGVVEVNDLVDFRRSAEEPVVGAALLRRHAPVAGRTTCCTVRALSASRPARPGLRRRGSTGPPGAAGSVPLKRRLLAASHHRAGSVYPVQPRSSTRIACCRRRWRAE